VVRRDDDEERPSHAGVARGGVRPMSGAPGGDGEDRGAFAFAQMVARVDGSLARPDRRYFRVGSRSVDQHAGPAADSSGDAVGSARSFCLDADPGTATRRHGVSVSTGERFARRSGPRARHSDARQRQLTRCGRSGADGAERSAVRSAGRDGADIRGRAGAAGATASRASRPSAGRGAL